MNQTFTVCLVTELLSHPLDEGMNRLAYHLAEHLSNNVPFRAFTNARNSVAVSWLKNLAFDNALLNRAFFEKSQRFIRLMESTFHDRL